MAIIIENGVPIPGRRATNPEREAMKSMKVGDSFFSPLLALRLRNDIAAVRRVSRFSFIVRTLADGGCRVWRTQ